MEEKLLRDGSFKKYVKIRMKERENNENLSEHFEGPLNKTDNDIIFEELISEIIQDFDREENKKKVSFYEGKNTDETPSLTFLHIYGHYISLPELFSKVNLNHIEISQKQLKEYEEYITEIDLIKELNLKTSKGFLLNQKNSLKSKINNQEYLLDCIENSNFIKEEEKIINRIRLKSILDSLYPLEGLNNSELLAIYLYTETNLIPDKIKSLLRQEEKELSFDIHINKIKKKSLPFLLATISIATQGLNKLPRDQRVVSRMEDHFPYLNDIGFDMGKIHRTKIFSSTSRLAPENYGDFFAERPIQILYRNVDVKDISGVAKCSNENESLLPPHSTLRLLDHKKVGKKDVFIVEGVNGTLNERRKSDINFRKKPGIRKSTKL